MYIYIYIYVCIFPTFRTLTTAIHGPKALLVPAPLALLLQAQGDVGRQPRGATGELLQGTQDLMAMGDRFLAGKNPFKDVKHSHKW